MTRQLFFSVLPVKTAKLFAAFQHSASIFLQDFYLSGGTALALHLGHRESEDLDFFSERLFDPAAIEQALQPFGRLSDTQRDRGTLNTFVGGVKLQFLHYPDHLLERPVDADGIRISSLLDIACTKIQTIGSRGSKKDFIDLYFILNTYSLPIILEAVARKYQGIDYSQAHLIKSLVYFDDADTQPMPILHLPVDWDTVKRTMLDQVRNIKF